jgi:hypothetical protein
VVLAWLASRCVQARSILQSLTASKLGEHEDAIRANVAASAAAQATADEALAKGASPWRLLLALARPRSRAPECHT